MYCAFSVGLRHVIEFKGHIQFNTVHASNFFSLAINPSDFGSVVLLKKTRVGEELNYSTLCVGSTKVYIFCMICTTVFATVLQSEFANNQGNIYFQCICFLCVNLSYIKVASNGSGLELEDPCSLPFFYICSLS